MLFLDGRIKGLNNENTNILEKKGEFKEIKEDFEKIKLNLQSIATLKAKETEKSTAVTEYPEIKNIEDKMKEIESLIKEKEKKEKDKKEKEEREKEKEEREKKEKEENKKKKEKEEREKKEKEEKEKEKKEKEKKEKEEREKKEKEKKVVEEKKKEVEKEEVKKEKVIEGKKEEEEKKKEEEEKKEEKVEEKKEKEEREKKDEKKEEEKVGEEKKEEKEEEKKEEKKEEEKKEEEKKEVEKKEEEKKEEEKKEEEKKDEKEEKKEKEKKEEEKVIEEKKEEEKKEEEKKEEGKKEEEKKENEKEKVGKKEDEKKEEEEKKEGKVEEEKKEEEKNEEKKKEEKKEKEEEKKEGEKKKEEKEKEEKEEKEEEKKGEEKKEERKKEEEKKEEKEEKVVDEKKEEEKKEEGKKEEEKVEEKKEEKKKEVIGEEKVEEKKVEKKDVEKKVEIRNAQAFTGATSATQQLVNWNNLLNPIDDLKREIDEFFAEKKDIVEKKDIEGKKDIVEKKGIVEKKAELEKIKEKFEKLKKDSKKMYENIDKDAVKSVGTITANDETKRKVLLSKFNEEYAAKNAIETKEKIKSMIKEMEEKINKEGPVIEAEAKKFVEDKKRKEEEEKKLKEKNDRLSKENAAKLKKFLANGGALQQNKNKLPIELKNLQDFITQKVSEYSVLDNNDKISNLSDSLSVVEAKNLFNYAKSDKKNSIDSEEKKFNEALNNLGDNLNKLENNELYSDEKVSGVFMDKTIKECNPNIESEQIKSFYKDVDKEMSNLLVEEKKNSKWNGKNEEEKTERLMEIRNEAFKKVVGKKGEFITTHKDGDLTIQTSYKNFYTKHKEDIDKIEEKIKSKEKEINETIASIKNNEKTAKAVISDHANEITKAMTDCLEKNAFPSTTPDKNASIRKKKILDNINKNRKTIKSDLERELDENLKSSKFRNRLKSDRKAAIASEEKKDAPKRATDSVASNKSSQKTGESKTSVVPQNMAKASATTSKPIPPASVKKNTISTPSTQPAPSTQPVKNQSEVKQPIMGLRNLIAQKVSKNSELTEDNVGYKNLSEEGIVYLLGTIISSSEVSYANIIEDAEKTFDEAQKILLAETNKLENNELYKDAEKNNRLMSEIIETKNIAEDEKKKIKFFYKRLHQEMETNNNKKVKDGKINENAETEEERMERMMKARREAFKKIIAEKDEFIVDKDNTRISFSDFYKKHKEGIEAVEKEIETTKNEEINKSIALIRDSKKNMNKVIEDHAKDIIDIIGKHLGKGAIAKDKKFYGEKKEKFSELEEKFRNCIEGNKSKIKSEMKKEIESNYFRNKIAKQNNEPVSMGK
ncbi:MAG: hypothetical protein LBB13_02460 [Rickettsiales bacterium]|jgi:hypothetical protein|nr:hypothetical protein [Rickettsiales bacterium]